VTVTSITAATNGETMDASSRSSTSITSTNTSYIRAVVNSNGTKLLHLDELGE
jgi:hypothetical protein